MHFRRWSSGTMRYGSCSYWQRDSAPSCVFEEFSLPLFNSSSSSSLLGPSESFLRFDCLTLKYSTCLEISPHTAMSPKKWNYVEKTSKNDDEREWANKTFTERALSTDRRWQWKEHFCGISFLLNCWNRSNKKKPTDNRQAAKDLLIETWSRKHETGSEFLSRTNILPSPWRWT